MNAYELADELDGWSDHWLSDKGEDDVFKAHATMLRQQAGELEYYKVRDSSHVKTIKELAEKINNMEQWEKRYLDVIAGLEKDLYMIQRHYDQLETFSPNKIAKYEEVLQSIANDYHELSDHKIEVQVRNHKKWAREALSLSGNNAQDVSNTNETLPKGKE